MYHFTKLVVALYIFLGLSKINGCNYDFRCGCNGRGGGRRRHIYSGELGKADHAAEGSCNRVYKFADAIKGWQSRSLARTKFIDYCCRKYPGSIVCDYRAASKKYNDFATLANIAQRRGELYHTKRTGCLSLPDQRKMVVRLRLGDISLGAKEPDTRFRPMSH